MYEAPYVLCVAVDPLLSEPLCVMDFQGGVQKAKSKLRQLKLYVQLQLSNAFITNGIM